MLGRITVVVIVCAYFGLLFALGGHRSWDRLGVPDLEPTFLDMRSVTSGWVCTRRGIDVLPLNPCDPLKRPANYPRIWMKLAFLGLGPGSTVVLALLTAAAFFAAAVALLDPRSSVGEAVVYAAALCSPAAMLGVERGNVDLALFAVVSVAVIVARRDRLGRIVSPILVLAAAVLKLFPILAAGLLARQRRGLPVIGAVVLIFAAYALATIDDIRTIGKVVPQANDYSYGVDISGRWLAGRAHSQAWIFDAVLVIAGVGAAILLSRRLAQPIPSTASPATARAMDAFWAGAGIYVGTFCVFHSFDYRLVFLLLTIPQLLLWAREGRSIAYVTLAALLATLWLVRHDGLVAGAIAQIVLLAGLAAGLLATAPLLAHANLISRRRL